VSMSLGYTQTNQNIGNGANLYRTSTTYMWNATEGSSTATLGSLWFGWDETNSQASGAFDLDIRALFLPTLRGYSSMAELHVASSRDGDILDEALDFASTYDSAINLFSNFDQALADFDTILFNWAGVETVHSASRGQYMDDARKLEFLEVMLGSDFVQNADRFPDGNPGSLAAIEVMETYADYRDQAFANYVAQSATGAELFNESASYSFVTDALEFDLGTGQSVPSLNTTTLNALGTHGAGLSTTEAREEFWADIFDVIFKARGTSQTDINNNTAFDTTDQAALNAAIALSDASLDWQDVMDEYRIADGVNFTGTSGNDGTQANPFAGGEGDDVLNGLDGDDWIEGGNGQDHLIGGAGNDTLRSWGEGNILDGGDGNDFLRGSGQHNPPHKITTFGSAKIAAGKPFSSLENSLHWAA
jgi:Ca2+-binding RTX toxin-like protein